MTRHQLHDPGRARRAGQPLEPGGPRAVLASALLRNAAFARTVARRRATLIDGAVVVHNTQRPPRQVQVRGRRQDRSHRRRRLLPRRRRVELTACELHQRRARRSERIDARRRHARAVALRAGGLPRTCTAARAGQRYATVPRGRSPGRSAALVAQREPPARLPRRRAVSTSTGRSVRHDARRAAARPAAGSARSSSSRGTRRSEACRWSPQRAIAGAAGSDRRADPQGGWSCSGGVLLVVGCSLQLMRRRRRGWPTEIITVVRPMIITVTLNAAIDKSLSVPNFRLGRRHRTVERRDARRAARASTSRGRSRRSASR